MIDYTQLEEGHKLENGFVISRCPICGRNGIVSRAGDSVTTTHHELEVWTTAGGEARGREPRKDSRCFRRNA